MWEDMGVVVGLSASTLVWALTFGRKLKVLRLEVGEANDQHEGNGSDGDSPQHVHELANLSIAEAKYCNRDAEEPLGDQGSHPLALVAMDVHEILRHSDEAGGNLGRSADPELPHVDECCQLAPRVAAEALTQVDKGAPRLWEARTELAPDERITQAAEGSDRVAHERMRPHWFYSSEAERDGYERTSAEHHHRVEPDCLQKRVFGALSILCLARWLRDVFPELLQRHGDGASAASVALSALLQQQIASELPFSSTRVGSAYDADLCASGRDANSQR